MGWLHLSATGKNGARNMDVHIFMSLLSVIWDNWILEVGLLGHMIILCLIFWGISTPLSTVAVPFHIPTKGVQGSNFSSSFTNTCYFIFGVFFLINSDPNGCA